MKRGRTGRANVAVKRHWMQAKRERWRLTDRGRCEKNEQDRKEREEGARGEGDKEGLKRAAFYSPG